ncbi:AAA family ATPase [Halarcobacter bivalviorum]|uniref:ATPase n=1 Tax=Halarcobacter bivalviorum TaxID=663364 RepID=A0AAX2AAM5_9BACT|nr:AAA family ATPase [Halarcobacter bivalviorum]AXH12215.1 hypothetical protein ABIV_1215 [Halarcobacter bivalviorum]RXK11322.1 ATPase [Halarcobacter bivalviorum]
MAKEEIYSQIDKFNINIVNSKETKNNKYYYINSDEALIKSQFINEIQNDTVIKEKLDSIETVMDLCFGSGNLTSHILLENQIEYQNIILNDYFLDECNQELENLLENCELNQCNFFNSDCFEENSVDLLIFNPTHGGKPTKKDFINKENKDFDALNKTLSKILKPNSLVIFRGWKEDFQELIFSEFKYKKIYLDGSQSLYVCYDIEAEEKVCYEYTNNEFIENENCEIEKSSNEEDLDIGELMEELEENKTENDFNGVLKTESTNVNKIQLDNTKIKKRKFSDEVKGNLNFPYKNILFKGVPGTGKSRAINEIIRNKLELAKNDKNVLRINIHSASSNSDLMQGIGISTTNNGNIKYSEKQGLILDIIKRATFNPNQPFVLILEEIQENSLNELIGDLIYLIEDDKRAKLIADNLEYETYEELVDKLVKKDDTLDYVEIPYLVNDSTDYKKMIMPNNLYIFCTSNYRDDKKVIEDNLLRRFEVIEIYPKETIVNDYAKDFFDKLNKSINTIMEKQGEIHPDRFLIGHAIWKDVKDKEAFYKAFSKLIIEFKDIREIEFDIFKSIVEDLPFPADLSINVENSYYEMIKDIQSKIKYEFID